MILFFSKLICNMCFILWRDFLWIFHHRFVMYYYLSLSLVDIRLCCCWICPFILSSFKPIINTFLGFIPSIIVLHQYQRSVSSHEFINWHFKVYLYNREYYHVSFFKYILSHFHLITTATVVLMRKNPNSGHKWSSDYHQSNQHCQTPLDY